MMAAKLPGFIPEELRQLARFIPVRGWDVIDWKPMLGSLRTVSWRYVSRRGVDKLSAAVTGNVAAPVRLVSALEEVTPIAEIDDKRRLRQCGDDIVRLYFAQWLVAEGMFIDLRAARFGVDEDGLLFAPNGLWIALRPEFRAGMTALYRSFYSADEVAFDTALRQMGMLRDDLSPGAVQELKQLLFKHFGIDQASQRFSIDTFKASFDELFAFFIEQDYKLHSDFVFVGFYLITLYLTLEQLGQSHNVRKICADVLL
jgi:predicted unusual protein kinase regulating ubiquinone biosynthesis (AarF/ABC1/UbiB family)